MGDVLPPFVGKLHYTRKRTFEKSDTHTGCLLPVFCKVITNFISVFSFSNYGTIMDLEQRQRYQQDFSAEYDEYKDLHSRIATITHMFVQLASKIKSLSPGTPEYKVLTAHTAKWQNNLRMCHSVKTIATALFLYPCR